MRIIFISYILFLSLALRGQNDTQYWYFGWNAGVKFTKTGYTVDPNGKVSNWEGTASLTTKNGSFFYSDGRSVFNKFHHKIPNIELKGRESSTQGILMLMHPENDSTMYALTNSDGGGLDCPSYFYELHIADDTSLILRNEILLQYLGTEKVTSCYHHNNRDIWILSHSYGGNNFDRYLLTKNGIIRCIDRQPIGISYDNTIKTAAGQLKFTSKGDILCSATWVASKIELFKFNNKTGMLSDSISLDNLYNYGAEFSPNGKYLYISNVFGNLFQYNLTSWNADSIENSKTLITAKGRKEISALQLAPNGKIYWSFRDSTYLSCINFPDRNGDSCGLNFRQIYLGGKKCAAGLPTFNQSVFYTPSIDFSYRIDCDHTIHMEGKDTFASTAQQWDFQKEGGPWQSKGNSVSADFLLPDTGQFNIRYIASKAGRSDTAVKTIHIAPKVNKHFLGDDIMYKGGTPFSKTIKAPAGMRCYLWHDSSRTSSFEADSAGIYICKVLTPNLCEITDTIIITECINNLTPPSIFRRHDTLFTYQPQADSFIWFRNEVPYVVSKQPYLKLVDTGHYRVEVAKKGHCNRSSQVSWVNKIKLGLLALHNLDIRVYPNPSQGTVFISSTDDFDMLITDITGRTILSGKNTEQVNLKSGVYFFNFLCNGYRTIEKVVIY